eukprot:s966_g21.t1
MLIVLSDFLLPENVTPQALLEEFEQCDLVKLHFPKSDGTVRMPQAYLQFGDSASRRKAHAKNEKYILDCQLQLHYSSQHSLAEAIQQCHFSTYEMASYKMQRQVLAARMGQTQEMPKPGSVVEDTLPLQMRGPKAPNAAHGEGRRDAAYAWPANPAIWRLVTSTACSAQDEYACSTSASSAGVRHATGSDPKIKREQVASSSSAKVRPTALAPGECWLRVMVTNHLSPDVWKTEPLKKLNELNEFFQKLLGRRQRRQLLLISC